MIEERHTHMHGMRGEARLFHVCARDSHSAHATTLFSREGNLYGAVLSERLVKLRNLISALVHELRSAVQNDAEQQNDSHPFGRSG